MDSNDYSMTGIDNKPEPSESLQHAPPQYEEDSETAASNTMAAPSSSQWSSASTEATPAAAEMEAASHATSNSNPYTRPNMPLSQAPTVRNRRSYRVSVLFSNDNLANASTNANDAANSASQEPAAVSPSPLSAASRTYRPLSTYGATRNQKHASRQSVFIPGPADPIPEGQELPPVPLNQKSPIEQYFSNWMVNEGPRVIFFVAYLAANFILFFVTFNQFLYSNDYQGVRSIIGYGLPIARAAAACINMNSCLILVPVCRNLISLLRTTFLNRIIPFDKNITFHKAIAGAIVFFSAVHSVAHFFNYLHLSSGQFPVYKSNLDIIYGTGPGITGILLWIFLFLIVSSSMEIIRRKYFEVFWFTHHLFVLYLSFILVHGCFCFIKADNDPKCRGFTFWKWLLGPLFLYLLERIYRELRGRVPLTQITKVIQHPSDVIEIQIRKPSARCKAGQYIFLNCPEVSKLEWHPFTLTSAPEEDFLSVHIRIVGDWTKALAQRLGAVPLDGNPHGAPHRFANKIGTIPQVYVDGPFGSAAEDVFKYQAAVCIGAGIGVTPFASVLKSIWYHVVNPVASTKLKKVYFLWICREKQAFEWFQDLLEAIEEEDIDQFLEIRLFLTAAMSPDTVKNIMIKDEVGHDALTGLRAPTYYGRPNFDQIFQSIVRAHPDTDIGVFFCGPKVISTALHKLCNKYTNAQPGGTKFYYSKENF